MSILSDTEIRLGRARGHIVLKHADEAAIQPASFDLHLGRHYAVPLAREDRPPAVVRPYSVEDPDSLWTRITVKNYLLVPGQFLLATTREEIRLDSTVYARVEGKSTLGRWGLLVHTTAGFIDPGFHGPITLELRNVGPFALDLYEGMRICQIAFGGVYGRVERAYAGHYQNQQGVGLPY